ncbi:MAG: hypothetical protein D6690_12420 [Nitrospirae bacterium]|nr:MAG: hypothetical protein D6690_12420 [Nitrospirota bacterium]
MHRWILLTIPVVLVACSGYREEFSCRTNPDSGVCGRTLDVYAMGHDLPAGESPQAAGDPEGKDFAGEPPRPVLGKPIVEPPEVWRLWVKPWRDDGDTLHEASVHYVLLKPGRFAYGVSIPKSVRSAFRRRIVTPYTSELIESGRPAPSGPPGQTSSTGPGARKANLLPPDFQQRLRALSKGQPTSGGR